MDNHPLSEMFPEMAQEDRRELMEHMAAHGQLHPIVTHEGMILDGRNRYWCCLVLGVAPVLKEWDGEAGSPLAYVVGCNLQRRHLTPGQRAAIALSVKDRLAEEYRERQLAGLKRGKEKPGARFRNNSETGKDAQRDAAAMMRVNPHYVSDAERIREASPVVFEAVKRGDATIPDGRRIVADVETLAALEAGEIEVAEAKDRARRLTPPVVEGPARLSLSVPLDDAAEAARVLLQHFRGEALAELIEALARGVDS